MNTPEREQARRNVFARLPRRFGGSVDDDEARVTELHWSDGRVVQISSWPDDDGVLIRVWPANGTAEYGGGNITTLSASVRFNDDGSDEIESLDISKPLGNAVAVAEALPLVCVKCGCDDINVRWHSHGGRYGEGACGGHAKLVEYGEHMHFICRTCRYEWTGEPNDGALTAATALQRSNQEVVPAAPEVWVREPECVERWPECESGMYDPRCCRFPKSCSCLRPAPEVLPEETP